MREISKFYMYEFVWEGKIVFQQEFNEPDISERRAKFYKETKIGIIDTDTQELECKGTNLKFYIDTDPIKIDYLVDDDLFILDYFSLNEHDEIKAYQFMVKFFANKYIESEMSKCHSNRDIEKFFEEQEYERDK